MELLLLLRAAAFPQPTKPRAEAVEDTRATACLDGPGLEAAHTRIKRPSAFKEQNMV
jgi:hypothetical protein